MHSDIEKYQRFLCSLLRTINSRYRYNVAAVVPNECEGVLEIHVSYDGQKDLITKVFIDSQNLNIPYPNMIQTIPIESILDGTIPNESYIVSCIFKALEEQRQDQIKRNAIIKKHEQLVEAQDAVI